MSDVPNEKSIPPPQESTELADSKTEGKIPASVSDGAYKNLVAQIDSILAHSNERSIKSRYRYYEAAKRFCRFLADNYRLQKFKNVKERHFRTYAEHLKENNAATTIQTDLSGIRYNDTQAVAGLQTYGTFFLQSHRYIRLNILQIYHICRSLARCYHKDCNY